MTDSPLIRLRAVFCRFQVEGVHRLNHFSDDQRHLHRHIFHFKVTINAADDEATEILNPVRLRQMCRSQFATDAIAPINFEDRQTPQIAEELALALWYAFEGRGVRVDVSEDGENGATVTYGM